VFENRVLRRIFGPKRDGVTGGWRKLHNEELHNLYPSPSKIRIIKSRKMRLAKHVARMGEKRNLYRLMVGKPEGKRPLGRPRRRWIDNIKMTLVEVGWSSVVACLTCKLLLKATTVLNVVASLHRWCMQTTCLEQH
jgi:hypothetical protein